MRCWLIAGVIGLAGGLFFTLAPTAGQEAPDQAKKNEDFYKGRSALGRRANGVRLQVATVAPAGDKGDEIRLDWTLDYEGPRPPLIILEPSLERDTGGQTVVVFYAESKDRRPHGYDMASPPNVGRGAFSPKNFFIAVEKGKQGSGAITVPIAKLREYYTKHWPAQFGDVVPVLWVQLRHKPFDRGSGFDLDAWTGEVYSPVVKVPLPKW